MRPVTITLTDDELKLADEIGNRRQDDAERDGKRPANGFDGNPRACHVLGARGELAVAKALGVPWDATVNTFHSRGDIGDIEVRTRTSHAYDLYVRPDDVESRKFVMVVGIDREFTIYGWMHGTDVKKWGGWHNYGNKPYAWFLEKKYLHPLDTLLEDAACAS